MIVTHIDVDVLNAHLIEHFLSHLIKQIKDINESETIYTYVVSNIKKTQVFNGVKFKNDTYYTHKDKNGNSWIVISDKYLSRSKESIIKKAVIKVALLMFIIAFILPISLIFIFWMIENKSIKIWSINSEKRVKRKNSIKFTSRIELRLVNSIYYLIGMHKIYDTYCNKDICSDLRVFDYASKYRDSMLDKYLTLNLDETSK